MTAVGKIDLDRTYRVCLECGEPRFPADVAIGLAGFVTRRALRQICRAGASDSFGRAERTLEELAGWSVDAETIRRLCHAEAAKRLENKAEQRETAQRFQQAFGNWELQIDAGKVNTDTGWRDVKVAVFAVRKPGPASSSEDYEQRDLPTPSVRRVIASIETAETFGRRCRAEAHGIGLADASKLTVLGDGAEWIWNLADERFPKAEQNLDVFHATAYLADLGRAGFGEGTAKAVEWTDSARKRLVADGWAGVCEFVHASVSAVKDRTAFESAYPRVANYLAGHRDRIKYAARLRLGKSIGSGMIEGTIKQVVNRRMKQTGARWKAEHVGPLVELIGLVDGPTWEAYWSAA